MLLFISDEYPLKRDFGFGHDMLRNEGAGQSVISGTQNNELIMIFRLMAGKTIDGAH